MRANKLYKALSIVLISVLLTCGLSGCGNRKLSESVHLALVGVGHQNMPVFSADIQAIVDWLYKVAYSHGTVTMATIEGSPRVFFQAKVDEADVKGLSRKKQKSIAEDYTGQMQTAYKEGKPITPEVDTLKSITLASRSLIDVGGEKILVIVDSGLQTIGYLNFTNGLLEADPKDIVDALIQLKALPDLSGVRCIWIGLGGTFAPQEELSERQKANLETIWESVLYAAGAESVEFNHGYSTGTAYKSAPPVTTVPVESEVLNVATTTKTVDPTIDVKPLETVILDETRLQFLGDQAVFADEAQAQRVLESTANTLINHPNNNVYILGTTAGSDGNSDYTMKLSQARADVVKTKLVSMGVPESQMRAIGLGSSDPYHEYDLDENGNMIEEIAKRNRKTIIMDANSSEAKLIE